RAVDRDDRATVCEHVMESEVEAVAVRLELAAVDRARARIRRAAAALRTAESLVARAVLDEQHLHPAVRRRFERLLPAGRGAAVPAGFGLPLLERFGHLARASLLEVRPDDL